MKVAEALAEGRRRLGAVSDEAVLDAELLLREALQLDRVKLYQNLSSQIGVRQSAKYRELLDRRRATEPTPYILGRKEFFGLEFEVTPAAIIPRPETETLIEAVVAFAEQASRDVTIADVGTGSGVIAISLAQLIPGARLIATDTSPQALHLARLNAAAHGVSDRMSFVGGDLLAFLDSRVDVIVANLPYIPTDKWQALPPGIRDHEPRSGLDGGPDGLRTVERLIRQAPGRLNAGGAMFLEVGHDQASDVRALARGAFPRAEIAARQDLAGWDRVICVFAQAG